MSPRVELLRFMEGLGANMRALAGPTYFEEKKCVCVYAYVRVRVRVRVYILFCTVHAFYSN